MILYHITKARNIDSIIKNGLVPPGDRRPYNRGLTTRPVEPDAVWLTNDIHHILHNQCGYSHILRENVCVMMVDVRDLELVNKYDKELLYFGTINPERIMGIYTLTVNLFRDMD